MLCPRSECYMSWAEHAQSALEGAGCSHYDHFTVSSAPAWLPTVIVGVADGGSK